MTNMEPQGVTIYTFYTYALPVMGLIGIFGNLLIAVVFLKGEQSSTTTFFVSLALSDIGYTLSFILYTWLRVTFGIAETNAMYNCNVLSYFTISFVYVSNSTIAVVVLERVLAVKVPHRVKIFCTRRVSLWIVAVLWVMVFLLNTHMLIGFGNFAVGNSTLLEEAIGCKFKSEWYAKFITQIMVYIELFGLILPQLLIIVIGNIVIVISLYRAALQTPSTQRTKQMKAITIKTMAVSTFHLMCMLPWSIYAIYIGSTDVPDEEIQSYVSLSHAFNICPHLQATFNILLYMLFGARFRKDVKDFLCGRFLR